MSDFIPLPLSRFKEDEEGFVENDQGLSYQSLLDLISIEYLFTCGCGMPEANALYVLGALRLVNEGKFRECREYFANSAGAEYFMWYWLAHHEYTEHGGSVPGWLTDKGKQLLSDL